MSNLGLLLSLEPSKKFVVVVVSDVDGVNREGVEDTKADGGLNTKEIATEDDEGEEKLLDIVNIFID